MDKNKKTIKTQPDEEKNLSGIPVEETPTDTAKKRRTALSTRLLKGVAWTIAAPFLLFLLLTFVVYMPPVQQWAVQKACLWLSDEMDMDASVDRVRLCFPLDLHMDNLTVRQRTDSTGMGRMSLKAQSIGVSVRFAPLLEGQIETDGVSLKQVEMNTGGLIEALTVKGRVGRLWLDAHSINLKNGFARINHIALTDADLHLALADSVPEDTTTEAPVLRRLLLDDVRLHRVRLALQLAPQSDSMRVAALLDEARLKAALDLEEKDFVFERIYLDRSSLALDLGLGRPAPKGFDATHLALSKVGARIPKVSYRGTGELTAQIEQLAATDRSGLQVGRLSGAVAMDSSRLMLDNLVLQTPESDLQVNLKMDLNAFSLPTPEQPDVQPGQFRVKARGHVARTDIGLLSEPYAPGMAKYIPNKQLFVDVAAQGNLQELQVNRLVAHMPGVMRLKADARLEHATAAPDRMGATTHAEAHFDNLEWVKSLLPAGTRSSVRLPHNLTLSIDATLRQGRLAARGQMQAPRGKARFDVAYGMNYEDYRAEVDADRLDVGQFVALDSPLSLTASVKAHGKGFDFFSSRTRAEATADIRQGHYGKMDLSNAGTELAFAAGQLTCRLNCHNPQLKTNLNLTGQVQRDALTGHLVLDLPHADAQAMGFSNDVLKVRALGTADVRIDRKNDFDIQAYVDDIGLWIGEDSLQTERLDLTALSQRDTTVLCLKTGDLDFDFHSPENWQTLLKKTARIQSVAYRQWKQKTINADVLKGYFPRAVLRADIGSENPLAKILSLYDVKFAAVQADLQSNPENGLLGTACGTGIEVQSVKVDSVFLTMRQDSTQFEFDAGVKCRDQELFPAFSATLDGYVSPEDADVHLAYYNKRKVKGVDLGIHALLTDTLLQASLYPEHPIIGFKKFNLNPDNFIRLERKNRMFADVQLTGDKDDSRISIMANPEDSLLQSVHAIVQNLDLRDIVSIVPGMPDMAGLFNLDATYRQTERRFWVNGNTGIRNFAYEGTKVGNVSSLFDYEPLGRNVHRVDMAVAYDSTDVASVEGTYDASGNGNLDAAVHLNDLPLAMTAPFIPDQIVRLGGALGGMLTVKGPMDALNINGQLQPKDMTVTSDMYAVNLRCANSPWTIENSRISFDNYAMYGSTDNPLTLNGWVDFSDMEAVQTTLSLYGRNFKLVDAPRNARSVIFGDMYGDFFARVNGTPDHMTMRGLVRVLNNTDMTYVMEDTPLSISDRLSDIVTFVDFSLPPSRNAEPEKKASLGMDIQLNLVVEDGAALNCEFSADKQSYVNVKGGGSFVLNSTPEGLMTLIGRYTVSEGKMKYTLPVIPLKTFTIAPDSYVEFTGDVMNPTLDFSATEQTKATVTDASGSSRSVLFNTGLKVTGTLERMELLFTIEAPEDLSVQNELAALPKEDKNKLAVGLLCTGLYMSASNSSGISASNALNNFLQNEINNIAGKAMATTMVDVNVGMEQNTRDDGTTRTDYAFKFSRRFFSDRLNVVVGGRVSADGNTQGNEAGAYIDDVSLEWRLNKSGTRYVRLYHEKNYDNLIEGELVENGGSLVLRKKLDKLSELLIWRKGE